MEEVRGPGAKSRVPLCSLGGVSRVVRGSPGLNLARGWGPLPEWCSRARVSRGSPRPRVCPRAPCTHLNKVLWLSLRKEGRNGAYEISPSRLGPHETPPVNGQPSDPSDSVVILGLLPCLSCLVFCPVLFSRGAGSLVQKLGSRGFRWAVLAGDRVIPG